MLFEVHVQPTVPTPENFLQSEEWMMIAMDVLHGPAIQVIPNGLGGQSMNNTDWTGVEQTRA